MGIHFKKQLLVLSAAGFLFLAGCGSNELQPLKSGTAEVPVVVDNIVKVRTAGAAGETEVLLVPRSAIVRQGELTGIFVVGDDDRLSLRWIRTGRLIHGDIVVLGGLDKGEFVVGIYNPALNEGVTVKKSPRVTEEVQSK
ncbi:MAG: hypothetical protein WCG19_02490 [Chlorobiaceae bacterium]